jgi:uncharacterized protein (DUF1697 family)
MRYIAFLRAINTGSRRIKMADLRELYASLGYREAATYIATGNVIFDSDSAPDVARLEEAFEARFGFASEVFLRDEEEIATLLERVPWTSEEGVAEVSFLEFEADAEAGRALEATGVQPEALHVLGREVLFLREGGGAPTTHKESTSMKILGMKMTRRGLATVRKIHDKHLGEGTTFHAEAAEDSSAMEILE